MSKNQEITTSKNGSEVFVTVKKNDGSEQKYTVGEVRVLINGDKKCCAYTEHADVVFDATTFNLHVFPNNAKLCAQLSGIIAEVRESVYNGIKDKYTIVKNGSDGRIRRLSNKDKVFSATKDPDTLVSANNLYQYLRVIKGEYCYDIVFFRNTCSNNNVVGCSWPAIQFQKMPTDEITISGQHIDVSGRTISFDLNHHNIKVKAVDINKGEDGFNICYTATDKDSRDDGVDKSKYYKTNGINVCYNPPVDWDNISGIVEEFIKFIKNEGEIPYQI